MSSTADPIVVNGDFYPAETDPVMAAIRDAIVNAPTGQTGLALERFQALADLTAENVVVIDDDNEEDDWSAKVNEAVATTTGLCLLILTGDATNPDTTAPGPQIQVTVSMQLFIDKSLRPDGAAKPMQIVVALARFLHQSQMRIAGFPWFEEFVCTGWEDLDDALFAKQINFNRILSL